MRGTSLPLYHQASETERGRGRLFYRMVISARRFLDLITPFARDQRAAIWYIRNYCLGRSARRSSRVIASFPHQRAPVLRQSSRRRPRARRHGSA